MNKNRNSVSLIHTKQLILLIVFGLTLLSKTCVAQLAPRVQFGTTTYPVSGLAYSPDSTQVAVVGSGDIQIYSAVTGQLTSVLWRDAQCFIEAVAFSPDGKSIAIGGTENSSGILEIWDLASEAPISTFRTSASTITSLAFTPDGQKLAGGGYSNFGGVLELWSVATKTLLVSPQTGANGILSVAISPDGQTLADAGDDLDLWSVSTGASIKKFEGLNCYRVVFSPDGKSLADTTWQGPIEVRNTTTFAISQKIPTKINPNLLAFSTDSEALIDANGLYYLGFGNSTVERWNLASSSQVFSVTNSYHGYEAIAISPDGKTVALGGAGNEDFGTLDLLNQEKGYPVLSIATSSSTGAIASSPDNRTLAWAGLGSAITLLNSQNGRSRSISCSGSGILECVAYSPTGSFLADGGRNGSAGLLELRTAPMGALISNLNTSATIVNSIAFSSQGNLLAVGGIKIGSNGQTSGVLELWDVSTQTLRATLETGSDGGIFGVAFAPDGSTVADCGFSKATRKGIVELWDVDSGSQLQNFPTLSYRVNEIAFLPNGKGLVTCGYFENDGWFELWDTSTGTLLSTTDEVSFFSNFVISPDGNFLCVIIPQGGSVEAIALPSFHPIFSWGWYPESPPHSLTFSPDGSQLFMANGQEISAARNPLYGGIPVSSLQLDPTTVIEGGTTTGTVTLSKAAPTGGTTVYLWSPYSGYEIFMPEKVTVPAGSTSASFHIETEVLDSMLTTTISAMSSGPAVTTAFTALAPLSSLSFSPNSIVAGASAKGTVSLTGPAPEGGSVVTLSSNASFVSVPASVTVPAGKSSATFTIQTIANSSKAPVTITATYGGTLTASLTVKPLYAASLALSPSTVIGGSATAVTGTVTLNNPAPSGGLLVSLTSSQTALATVSSSVTVPAGATSATFKVSPLFTTSYGTVFIKAIAGGVGQYAALGVFPLQISSLAISPTSIMGGGNATGTITLNAKVASPTVITLKANSPLTVPSTVTVPAGSSTVTFTIGTASVTKSTTVTVAGSLGSSAKSDKLTLTP